jgi:4-hydroxy-2-oxoheptanedioate aldolase
MGANPVRDKLMRGEVSLGSWLNLASPTSAEVMANAGYEWLVVDAEHSQWELNSIAHAFRAIQAGGAVPLARTWSHDYTAIGRLLDAGAMGIVAPHVSTPQQAEALASAMRYPPVGTRSAGSGRAQFAIPDYRNAINDAVMVIPQIEDLEGVNNIEAIMSVEGVDVAYLGPNDLGMSMGLTPDQHWKDPRHLDAISAVLEGAKKCGKPAGLPVMDVEAAKRFIDEGFLMIDLSNDLRMLQTAALSWLSELKS